MKALRAVVCGEVQGVGFRAAARRHALMLGLRGYARNLPDGCVEILVHPPDEAALRELLERLGRLRTARIDRVEIGEAEVESVPEGFEAL